MDVGSDDAVDVLEDFVADFVLVVLDLLAVVLVLDSAEASCLVELPITFLLEPFADAKAFCSSSR